MTRREGRSPLPTIVLATRDRRQRLLATRAHLHALPERPPVVVVDNGSTRASPLPSQLPLPGPPVLGFLACGAVARRSAVLACGGFHSRYGFGGEEHLLAVDMAAAGWGLAYVDDVVAHHEPARGPRSWQGVHELRNRLWSTWLRRPLPRAARITMELIADGDGRGLPAMVAAMQGLPWVLRKRRVVPEHVERCLRLLEQSSGA
jgi:hypothetical protein